MSELTLLGRNRDQEWIWNYHCDCGWRYRLAAEHGVARFWPATATFGFSRRSVPLGEPCIRCNRTLSLEGCTVQQLQGTPVLRPFPSRRRSGRICNPRVDGGRPSPRPLQRSRRTSP